MHKKSRPWVHEDGKLKTAAQIRKISRKWNGEQLKDYEQFLVGEQILDQKLWEIDLQRFETYQREETIDPALYDELVTTELTVADFVGSDDEKFTNNFVFYKKYLFSAMKMFTEKEKKIIEGIFWDVKSERQVGADLSISQSTVSKYKKNALAKVKKFLEEIEKELKLTRELSI